MPKKVGNGIMTQINKLPPDLTESSGVVSYGDHTIWTIEDSGNADKLFHVSFDGNIIEAIKVKNASNYDWEDLAKDEAGNIYIGDVGNNRNNRDDLVIYKVPNPNFLRKGKITAEKIKFSYPDQKEFPPEKHQRYFDAEALFYRNHSLYVVTRNRSKPFDGKAFVYKIPAIPGEYVAEKITEIQLCETPREHCAVTSGTVSPDGESVVLLTYTTLWVYENFTGDDFSNGTSKSFT